MKSDGYTLLEMVLVIVVIGILATVAAQSMLRTSENERVDTTLREMEAISRAIAGDERLISNGYRCDFGYVGDVGALPPDLDALIANPGGYSTWNGPYFRGGFVENAADYSNDAWGDAYTYAGSVTIQSSGNGSIITRRIANAAADLTSNTVTGFVRDSQGVPPGDAASKITVTITYPDGAGFVTSSSQSPARSGEFTFASMIPIGIHMIRAIETANNDTVSRYVAVYPALTAIADLRFSSSLFGSGGGGIELVDGSQDFFGGDCEDIEFYIINTSGSPITITSMTLTWTSPEAYYRRVRYDNITVWNQTNPRIGSGDQASFTPPQTIQPGDTARIRVEDFEDEPDDGNNVNMRFTTFTAVFSDGSTFDFTMGNCND